MNKRFIFAIVLMSLSSISMACPLSGLSLFDSLDGYHKVEFPKKVFSEYKELSSFDSVECKNSIRMASFEIDGKDYQATFTYEDSCDGGNSYGFVLEENKPVALVLDGNFSCL